MTARERIIAALEREQRRRARRIAALRQCDPAILAEALKTFESASGAGEWLLTPNIQLEGKSPVSLLRTKAGRTVVRQLLARIEHGVFT